MSLETRLPPYVRYDTTLPVVVPHDFSREKAIKALKCDRPCFLGKFPEVKLLPGPREIHLIHPSESKSLGEVLQILSSERTMRLEPLETALILAAQHRRYEIEFGVAFLAFLWSEGEKVNTTFFPYLSSGNGRHALHLRSDQRKLHSGWQIAVSSAVSAEKEVTGTEWIQKPLQPAAA